MDDHSYNRLIKTAEIIDRDEKRIGDALGSFRINKKNTTKEIALIKRNIIMVNDNIEIMTNIINKCLDDIEKEVSNV